MRNGLIIDDDGTQRWFLDDKLHRDNDLPAYIWPDGSQLWYHHGQIHRENDLPAIIDTDGSQSWWYHGRLHRDNGLPGVIYPDGHQSWYRHWKIILNTTVIILVSLRKSSQKFQTKQAPSHVVIIPSFPGWKIIVFDPFLNVDPFTIDIPLIDIPLRTIFSNDCRTILAMTLPA